MKSVLTIPLSLLLLLLLSHNIISKQSSQKLSNLWLKSPRDLQINSPNLYSSEIPNNVINPNQQLIIPLDDYFSGPLLNFTVKNISITSDLKSLDANQKHQQLYKKYIHQPVSEKICQKQNNIIKAPNEPIAMSAMLRNQYQSMVYMTMSIGNQLCQYDMTKYHNPGIIPHICNETSPIFANFTNNTNNVYCYNLSTLEVNQFISRPVLFCRQYNNTYNDLNLNDLLVPLVNAQPKSQDDTDFLYQYIIDPNQIYRIPRVNSSYIQMFNNRCLLTLQEIQPSDDGVSENDEYQASYSTVSIYIQNVSRKKVILFNKFQGQGSNSTFQNVANLTSSWFRNNTNEPIDTNINIIDFSLVSSQYLVLVDSSSRIFILYYTKSQDTPFDIKNLKLSKTIYFTQPIRDVFIKKDLAESYVVAKAARSSSIYILSLNDQHNPVIERKYECWIPNMCEMFVNNLPVTYNKNFVISVLSDDNNYQSVIQFYKRQSPYSSIPYFQIDMQMVEPKDIFVQFFDYRSDFFLLRSRNDISIQKMQSRQLSITAKSFQQFAIINGSIQAKVIFRHQRQSSIHESQNDFSASVDFQLYLSPIGDTSGYPRQQNSQIIVLQGSKQQFNAGSLFIGSNMTLSFYPIYNSTTQHDQFNQEDKIQQQLMFKQDEVKQWPFEDPCYDYRLQSAPRADGSTTIYEVCFSNHKIYYSSSHFDGYKILTYGDQYQLIYKDLIWNQQLNSYMIFTRFNQTTLKQRATQQDLHDIWRMGNSTFAFYYRISQD